MRTAVYYDSFFPPKNWIVSAGLIWDRVGISFAPMYLRRGVDPAMYQGLDFLRTLPADTQKNMLDVVHNLGHEEVSVLPDEITEFCLSFLSGKRYLKGMDFPSATNDQMKSLILTAESEYREMCLHEQAQKDLDIISTLGYGPFIGSPSAFTPNIVNASMSVLLPVNPGKVGASQFADFRAENELRRVRNRTTLNNLIDELSDSSTEKDFQRAVRLCEQALEEEHRKLRDTYRRTHIDAVLWAAGASFGTPSLVMVITSLLHAVCFAPAALIAAISLAGAQYLRTVEKGKAEIDNSPWTYLWYLTQLN